MRDETAKSMDAFLAALKPKSGGGASIRDIATKTGMGLSFVRSELKKLIVKGQAKHSGFRPEPNMAGRMSLIPLYQITKK
jgi:transposase